MKYNQLGTSDLRVSEVSFGCMSLKGTEAENTALLQHAMDAGINFFDTADLYEKGQNEMTVGKAFRGQRERVILATKVGNQWRSDGSGWDWNPSKSYIHQAVEQSLKRLQTDYIDLYQLHGGTIDDPIDETIEAFEILKEQGKIREYGISSIRPNVIREYVQRSNIVSVMMQYSLLDRRPEEQVLDLLHQEGVSVLTRGSLAQGLLAAKPAKKYLSFSENDTQKQVEALKALAQKKKVAVGTVAVRFVLQHPAVAAAVLGIRTERQLAEALETVSYPCLSPEQMIFLKSALNAAKYEQHR